MKTELQLKQGVEVVVCGPSVWGSWILQGNRGIIKGFGFSGFAVEMNASGDMFHFPETSLTIYDPSVTPPAD